MARAYENQFKTSYRLALNRGIGPQYFAGFFEASNREKAGQMERAKGDLITMVVCEVSATEIKRLEMPYSLAAGALTAEARNALAKRNGDVYLPHPIRQPRMLHAAPNAEMAKPEEVAEIQNAIAALANRRAMPKAEVIPIDAWREPDLSEAKEIFREI
jgi:hypothetical protein